MQHQQHPQKHKSLLLCFPGGHTEPIMVRYMFQCLVHIYSIYMYAEYMKYGASRPRLQYPIGAGYIHNTFSRLITDMYTTLYFLSSHTTSTILIIPSYVLFVIFLLGFFYSQFNHLMFQQWSLPEYFEQFVLKKITQTGSFLFNLKQNRKQQFWITCFYVLLNSNIL